MKLISEQEREAMVAAHEAGLTMPAIAERFGRSVSSVYNHVRAAGVQQRRHRKIGWTRNTIVVGRKNCAVCRRWRHLHDFVPDRRHVVGSRCRSCARADERAARRDPVRGPLRREYDRIWCEGQRRLAGTPERPFTTHRGGGGYVLLPVEPLVAVLDERLGFAEDDVARLARRSGVHERQIHRVRSGEIERVSLHVADSLVAAMGLHLSMVYGVDEEAVAA